MYYILGLLATVAAVAMAVYSTHLTLAPPRRKRKRPIVIIWGLAGLWVAFYGGDQWLMYRSNRMHEQKELERQRAAGKESGELKARLDDSLRKEEYMRGQLDSIALMVSKTGNAENNSDMKKLAQAIEKMAENSKRPLTRVELHGPGRVYTLPSMPPSPAAVQVYLNGLHLREGNDNDYTLTGRKLEFVQSYKLSRDDVVEVIY
jgi:hypothetical protein